MGARTYAGTTGLLGGAAWTAHHFVAHDALWWAGLALLTLACGTAGATLVSTSAPALRGFVAVAVPALVASVWWVVRDGVSDAEAADAMFGAGLALVALVVLSRTWGMAADDR